MSADTVCRVCLVKNLILYGVHIDLQNVYKIITRQKFNKVGYPVCMCYNCLSALRKCHRFMKTARDADRLLTQWRKQQNELGVAKPLSTYSTKIVLVSASEDISSEHDIKQENEDLAEQLAGDIETDISPPCQITEVKSIIETNEETQLLSAHETPTDLHTEIEIDETDEGDADDVCHTENVNIKFNPKPKKLNTKTTQNRKTLEICDVCGKFCASAIGLKRHVVLKHSTTQKLKKVDQKSKTLSKNVTRTHTGEKPFFCDKCGYNCAHKSALTLHMRIHTGEKPYSCDICDSTFTRKSYLTRHIRTHTGEKPFSCDVCDYKCTQKSSLTLHIRSHTGEKPFSCVVCDYKCTDKSNLTRHITIHTGEKSFSCNICDYKCTHKSTLTIHNRIHTGEKPYSCDICNYTFTKKSDLTRHIRTHSGEKPYSCDICDYKCTKKSYLTRHTRTHTGEKPFSCNICSYKCARKTNLNKHLVEHISNKPK